LPLAGVVGRADVMDAPLPGGLGGTYAGNPLACAAALATLDVFVEDDLLSNARRIGERLASALGALKDAHPQIVDARGLGAMRALEFADAPLAASIVDAARERGLLLLKAGAGNVIRLLAPLTIDAADLERGLAILSAACNSVLR
jgi:4-aminobutyrate aminotransferase-like enzyme